MEVDLFENYEQEFRNAYAQINKKLTSFQDLVGEEKYKSLKNLLKELDEIYELLEQMELELRDQTASQRGKLQSRVKSYRKDVEMLEKKLVFFNFAFIFVFCFCFHPNCNRNNWKKPVKMKSHVVNYLEAVLKISSPHPTISDSDF
eukprot:Sdes_comp19681_c0_seq2m11550